MLIKMKTYKTVNGISFHENTPDEVVEILLGAIKSDTTIILTYGDPATGKSWNEECDTKGRIGYSCGKIKVPLLIEPGQAGGHAISTDSIIKIRTKDGSDLYKIANYQEQEIENVPSEMKGYMFDTMINGELFARHKTEKQARYYTFLMS